MIETFWNTVQHILCADAPEGLVPEDMDDDTNMDTKEILSYSWRGLKEARCGFSPPFGSRPTNQNSVLLRVIISKAPIGDDERSLISPVFFEKLGRLCFTQLLELRHRGAFSTVSQTFAAFCRRCVSSDIKALRALPEIWYQVSAAYCFTSRSRLIKDRKLFNLSKRKPVRSLGDLLAFPPSWQASWLQTQASFSRVP